VLRGSATGVAATGSARAHALLWRPEIADVARASTELKPIKDHHPTDEPSPEHILQGSELQRVLAFWVKSITQATVPCFAPKRLCADFLS
jgi:hypothetical protein